MRLVDDTAACGDRCLEPRLDVLARDRHVDVHRVPQRLGLVEFLHPDGRSVSKGVDRIIVGQRRIIVGQRHVAEHGAPEADVNGIALGRDRELDFLDRRTIGHRAVRPRHCRHGPAATDRDSAEQSD